MRVTPLPFEREDSGETPGVVTLTLEQPGKPVVVLDSDLLKRIDATLDEIGTDIAGFVLASASERVFVAGANLVEIDGLSDPELHEYLEFGARVYGRIADLPCTTVAAINGAALGGGLEIAMHCDVLVGLRTPEGGKPYPVGLPEAGLGLCPGWGGTALLPARIDPEQAIRMTCTGKPMTSDQAADAGLLGELADDRAGLLALAKRIAARPKSGPGPRSIAQNDVGSGVRSTLERIRADLPQTKAAAAVVECIEAGLNSGWQAALECERRNLVSIRHTPEAREALEAFFNKGKSGRS
ncbi:MAG: enoyl-CoA hydratase/isomerase family protein [Phycisphaerales bacterium]